MEENTPTKHPSMQERRYGRNSRDVLVATTRPQVELRETKTDAASG
jgi:hypothetical protein